MSSLSPHLPGGEELDVAANKENSSVRCEARYHDERGNAPRPYAADSCHNRQSMANTTLSGSLKDVAANKDDVAPPIDHDSPSSTYDGPYPLKRSLGFTDISIKTDDNAGRGGVRPMK